MTNVKATIITGFLGAGNAAAFSSLWLHPLREPGSSGKPGRFKDAPGLWRRQVCPVSGQMFHQLPGMRRKRRDAARAKG